MFQKYVSSHHKSTFTKNVSETHLGSRVPRKMVSYNEYVSEVVDSLTMILPGASYLDKKTLASYRWNKLKGNPISQSQEFMAMCYDIFCGLLTFESLLELKGRNETIALFRYVAKWKQEDFDVIVNQLLS
jgi:hypothetical protein